jgi:hypothetical protein
MRQVPVESQPTTRRSVEAEAYSSSGVDRRPDPGREHSSEPTFEHTSIAQRRITAGGPRARSPLVRPTAPPASITRPGGREPAT